MRHLITLYFVVAIISLPLSSHAQGTTATLSPVISGNFNTALQAISDQAKVTFIVEGTPLFPRLSLKETESIPTQGSLDTVVTKLAVAYDYQVMVRPSGRRRYPSVFVLEKKYTNPADMPTVTYEECLAFAKEITRCLKKSVVSIADYGEFLVDFLSACSNSQKDAMAKGGLKMSELSTKQQAKLWDMAVFLYTLPAAFVSSPERLLRSETSTLRYNPDIRRLMLECPSPDEGPEFLLEEKDLQGYQPRLKPTDLKGLFQRQEATLQGAVTRIERSNKCTVAVADELSGKPMMLIGEQYSRSDALLPSIAEVFGLRSVVRGQDSFALLRPKIPAQISLQEFNATLATLVPRPLRRVTSISAEQYLSIKNRYASQKEQITRQLDKIAFKPGTQEPTPEELVLFEKLRKLGTGVPSRSQLNEQKVQPLNREVNYQHIIAFARALEGRDREKGIPFSTLDAYTRRLYAIQKVAAFSAEITESTNLPFAFTNFGELIVTLKTQPTPQGLKIGILLNKKTPKGLDVQGGLDGYDRSLKPVK